MPEYPNLSGTILSGGTETFKPIIERLLEITGEFVPYMIYIVIGIVGINLLWTAVQYIIGYLRAVATGDFDSGAKEYYGSYSAYKQDMEDRARQEEQEEKRYNQKNYKRRYKKHRRY